MANGPFGNPLSTGIALSFEVDMTPYREMHKRKLLAAKEKEEDQKKKQQQYADILKNITPPDASKIHKKYMPEVQNQYAELIDSAMGYINKNDVASLHKHMFEFDSNAKKAVQATENYKNYVNSDANKTFKSIEAIRAMEDDNTALSQISKDYQNDVEYGDGYLFWSTIERPDLLGETNKILQGAEKTIVFDGGKPVVTGRMPETDEVIYQESVKDPDKVIDYLSGWLMSSPGGNRLLMDYGGINAGQLDERTPDGMQKRAALAREYVSKEIEPKLYGQKISKIPEDKESKGYNDGYGKTDEYSYEFVDDPKPIYGNLPASQTGGRGGQELLVDVSNAIVFQNLGKTAKKFAINIPSGSFEIGSEGTEYTPISSTQKGLNDAIALQSYSDKNGKLWYKVASKAEIEQLDVFEAAYRRSQGVDDIDYTSLSKYAKTYLIPSSSEVDSQFWQGVGVDKKEREGIIKDLKKVPSAAGTSSTSAYTQITTLTDSSGNLINAGVKGGKWYNIDTGEEIK